MGPRARIPVVDGLARKFSSSGWVMNDLGLSLPRLTIHYSKFCLKFGKSEMRAGYQTSITALRFVSSCVSSSTTWNFVRNLENPKLKQSLRQAKPPTPRSFVRTPKTKMSAGAWPRQNRPLLAEVNPQKSLYVVFQFIAQNSENQIYEWNVLRYSL